MTSLAHAFEFDGLSDKQLVRERERLDALAREAAKEPKAND
jgi:hypothetical protein